MGGPGSSSLTIPKAMDIAKANTDVPPAVSAYLERKRAEVWTKIQQHPTSHVMTREEYMVMNYFAPTYSNNRQYADAVARFWKNFKGDPSEVDGVHASGSNSSH